MHCKRSQETRSIFVSAVLGMPSQSPHCQEARSSDYNFLASHELGESRHDRQIFATVRNPGACTPSVVERCPAALHWCCQTGDDITRARLDRSFEQGALDLFSKKRPRGVNLPEPPLAGLHQSWSNSIMNHFGSPGNGRGQDWFPDQGQSQRRPRPAAAGHRQPRQQRREVHRTRARVGARRCP